MSDPQEKLFSHFESPAESATMSLWRHNSEAGQLAYRSRTDFPPLGDNITTEIAIVGAGITGLTTALLLDRAGYQVALLDAHPVGYGVTGFNSGHLTSFPLDMKLRHILPAFGEEATRAVLLETEQALNQIARIVDDYRFDCGFRWVPGYLYTESAAQLKLLQEEYEAMGRTGVQANRTFNVPLPFPVEEGLHCSHQATLDPLKYAQGIALKLRDHGVPIYENSRVMDVEQPRNAGYLLKTEGGSVACQELVIATHTPIGFRPMAQIRLEAMRSYVIAFRSSNLLPDALFWDMDSPYHYLRMAEDELGPLIVLGGEDHKTGEVANTEQCFRNLEAFAQKRFDVQSIDYRWSAQLYNPADGLPYIGKTSDAYIATGFSGEGLTYGTLAARLIADQIQGVPNPCTEILNPNRTKPLASAGQLLSEGIHAVGHFVGDRLKKAQVQKPEDVPRGTGAICLLEGKKVAIYHSPEGVLHGLSPICTHMNCMVNWNQTETSWDCPCHGGRFTATGAVLNGPPVDDLMPVELEIDSMIQEE